MTQWFGLATPCDLLRKLRSDHTAFLAEPTNAYLAFNFFVTARHMLDWLYPDGKDPKGRQATIDKDKCLFKVCDHLANGLKHLELDPKRHKSVTRAHRGGGRMGADTFASRTWAAPSFGRTQLMVRLTGDAANALGSTIKATDLATKMLEFWEKHPDLANCGA